jgi:hypothetical protein
MVRRAGDPRQRARGSVLAASLRYRRRRMVRNPVTRDIDAATEPHAVVLEYMIKELLQPWCTAGAADKPVVQRERHHPRLALPFAVKHVEGVLHVGEEVLRRCEGHIAVEPIVVRLESRGASLRATRSVLRRARDR